MTPRIITAMRLKKRRIPVVEIELDNEPWATIDYEVALHHGLCKGLQLDGEDLEKISLESAERLARGRLVNYLATRLKTRRQAGQYLRRIEVPREMHDQVLDWAEARGLIDDARYAGAYVRTQKRLKLVGPRRLRSELARDGVPGEMADNAVEAHRGRDFQGLIEDDEEVPLDDGEVQRAECRKLLERRKDRLKREADPQKRRQKALRHLLSRGYEMQHAADAYREFLENANLEVADNSDGLF